MNLQGSIDLLKLDLAGIATIKGKKCLIIPIQENDIYISINENLKPKAAYLGVNIYERRETGKFGETHNVKQSFSKEFREKVGKEVMDKKPYLGNMKPMEVKSNNAVQTVSAEEVPANDIQDDELPF